VGEPDKTESRVLWSERRNLPADFATLDRPVVTVSAPAGYGKSTLLDRWRRTVAQAGAEVVWLAVDADDRDGDRLTLDLLRAVAPADAKRAQMLLGGVGDQGRRAIIMALLAELAARRPRTVLFIDDLHWLGDGAAESILQPLIAHQPDSLALVLSGRASLAGHVSEALLEGRLHRYGPAQLAFDENDVARLLAQHRLESRETLVKGLIGRTQGWPAVLRLIAITLQDSEGQKDDLLQNLLERRQEVTEYLSKVLLSRLPPRTARFLLSVALLRRFDAALAGAITGMDDAAALIDELDRRAVPLSASGDVGLPHALHPLVREFLLVRLRRDDPAWMRTLADRGSRWLTGHQRIDAAIDLSLDAGDIDGAVALIDRFSRSAARHLGRHGTFLYWCNKLPREQLIHYPRIQVIRVWSLNVIRRYAEADQILADLELSVEQASPSERDHVRALVDLEQCVQLTLRDQWMGLAPRVRAWLARWPDADTMHRGMAYTMVGCGEAASSEFENSLESLQTAHRLCEEAGVHYVVAWIGMWAASVMTKQGHYRQALHRCDEIVALIARRLGGQTPAEIMVHGLRGLLLYELGRLDEAGAALEHGLTALIEQSSVDSLIMGTVALARLQNARGMHLDALETLAEGETLGWTHELPRLAIALAAERIDLLLRQQEPAQAAELWRALERNVRRRDSAACDLALRDKSPRIEARLALLGGAFEAAGELVEPALAHAIGTGQKRKQVELLIVQALALHGGNDEEGSFAKLRRALEIAMPEAYVRVFVDEGEPLRALLAGLLATAPEPARRAAMREYIALLLAAYGSGSPNETDPPAAQSAVLTRRELKILGRLESSLSNRELADALFISEGTLKWHLKNIYSKLGVTSRIAAITTSRAKGLLR
jgi:ATP/maltotriose-dependent transcriptional regulator MalT